MNNIFSLRKNTFDNKIKSEVFIWLAKRLGARGRILILKQVRRYPKILIQPREVAAGKAVFPATDTVIKTVANS
jgi:hypothetical protein